MFGGSRVVSAGTMINATSVYGPVISTSPNWLADTYTAIQNSKTSGGLLGMLDNARVNDGSLRSFVQSSASASNAFSLISQNAVSSAGSLYAQMASQRSQEADVK